MPITDLHFVETWRKPIGPADSVVDVAIANQDRVDVWVAPVHRLANGDAYRNILGVDDAAMLKQITAAPARDVACAARILSQIGLSHATGWLIEPREWRIRGSLTGKPAVAEGLPKINFSIAHTDRVVVVAVSATLEVGIDVELIEHFVAHDVIAGFCYPSEQAALIKMPAQRMALEFVRLWTLKESYAKMTGIGHSVDFSSLGFSINSLRLLPECRGDFPALTYFETMWVVNRSVFNHVSVAIGFPAERRSQTPLQVITLAEGGGAESAVQSPCINI